MAKTQVRVWWISEQRKPLKKLVLSINVTTKLYSNERLMMDTVKRNYREVMEAVANGDVASVARKVKRSIEILREKNELSTLESVVLKQVERTADALA